MASKLEVVIVGAGIGGLAASVALGSSGHKVTVYESGSELTEIGAGIQVTPNFTRILTRWGLGEGLAKSGFQPQWLRQLRWKDGSTLTKFKANAGNRMAKDFGYPYYHIHRRDLQRLLYGRAVELGVVVQAATTAISYEPKGTGSRQRVRFQNGKWVEADLVVAADGIRGIFNSFILGEPVQSVATGDSAYRALLSAEQMSHPIFASLDFKTYASTWLGPDRHVVGYYVRNGEYYNVVILVPDEPSGEESWKLPGDMSKLREQFADWDPRIRKLLELIDESSVWKLRDRPSLKTWIHPEGEMVLLGDAAHPMLPYIAQGASSAAEDAVALATCLELATETRSLRQVLEVYEKIRIPRTSNMRNMARKNKDYFHLPDGPEQEARDAALAKESETGSTPNLLGDARKLQEIYGYDVVEEVKRYFQT